MFAKLFVVIFDGLIARPAFGQNPPLVVRCEDHAYWFGDGIAVGVLSFRSFRYLSETRWPAFAAAVDSFPNIEIPPLKIN